MKRFNLRQSLLFMALIPSALISVLLVTYFTMNGIRALEKELHENGLATVRHLAPISEYGIIAGQTEGLYSLVQATLLQPNIKSAVVVNTKGRTIAVSGRVSISAETLQRHLTQADKVGESENWVVYGAPVTRSTNELDPIFESITPDNVDRNEVIGHVFVELDKTLLRHNQNQILYQSLALIAVVLLLIYILASGMADNLARPLLRLVSAVRSMSSGRFNDRVPQNSSGEIGELEAGFNEMASHIEEMHRSMQERIEQATAQLAFQARHDALTGLLNRREFEERLTRALETIQTGGTESTFLFIDLDRFKPVNDTCGHLAGDELLRQMSQLLQGRLREGDLLARLGGDEFGILLNQCNGAAARQVAQDICNLTSAFRFIWQDKIFAVGASIGMTTIKPETRTVNSILAAADVACYRAKESGRNQIAEQEISGSPERRREAGGWQERILNAINEGRLLVDAQPISSLKPETPSTYRVQLVARLSEPGQTNISLSTLVDAAERYDLAEHIEQILLEKAIRSLARCRQSGKKIHYFVAVSAASLTEAETVNFISSTLARHNTAGEGLILVLSEDTIGRHIGHAIQFVRNVRQLGCQIAIDDFGGSISSFSHLRTLSPQYLKLSTSLTREFAGNRASTALLRAVLEIATDQGIMTIADNVDNNRQLDTLSELEINCAQGLAVGPTEPFDAWIEGTVMRGVI